MIRWIKLLLITFMLIMVLLLSINCMPSQKHMAKSNSEITLELTKSIVDQMFPGSKYSIENGIIYFSSQIEANYQTLYLAELKFGNFVENENEYFAVLRAPDNATCHAGGFNYLIGAVFDAKTNKIKSRNKDFISDEGEISVLNGKSRDYVLFLGSSTFQGYISPTGGAFYTSNGEWKQIWPESNEFWNDRYAVFGSNRLVLYKMVFENVNYETSGPPYHYEPEYELFWDSEAETFREPLR